MCTGRVVIVTGKTEPMDEVANLLLPTQVHGESVISLRCYSVLPPAVSKTLKAGICLKGSFIVPGRTAPGTGMYHSVGIGLSLNRMLP